MRIFDAPECGLEKARNEPRYVAHDVTRRFASRSKGVEGERQSGRKVRGQGTVSLPSGEWGGGCQSQPDDPAALASTLTA